MKSVIEFLSDPSIILQLIGGLIAVTAAICAIFYKDTVKEGTLKLTGWGWTTLIFLLLGAGISSGSKYYEFQTQQAKDKEQDSVREQQIRQLQTLIGTLTAFQNKSLGNDTIMQNSLTSSLTRLQNINADLTAATNSINPIFPFTIKYKLAIDLSRPALRDLLPRLKDLGNDLEDLTDKKIREVLTSYGNNSLNIIFNNDYRGLTINRVEFFNSNQNRIIYFCQLQSDSLRIQYSSKTNSFFIVDALEYYSSTKPVGNPKIQNLMQIQGEKFTLNIYKYFVPEISQDLYPQMWSNVDIQFAKQPVFTIKKRIDIRDDIREDYWWLKDFKVKRFDKVKGQTTLQYSLEKWDKVDIADY